MPSNTEFIYLSRVEGLPMLTGKLSLEGRRRAMKIEELEAERLAFALVEREEQLAQVMDKLRERS
jgi:hypothetical protein